MIVTVFKQSQEYRPEHVQWLAKQIGDQSPMVCISSTPIDGIDTIDMAHDFPGWWSKMEILRPDLDLGDFLYLDLDTVILGDIRKYLKQPSVTVLNDMGGGPHMNSGMMFIPKDADRTPYEHFIDRPDFIMTNHQGGDQQFLARYWSNCAKWQVKYLG